MADDDLGEQFGPYQVFERLGVGGMATVHRAKQQGIEGVSRVVALKRLLPHLAEDGAFIKSFVREAKLALLLQHANIVQLFELGKVRNVYFIAMEYIDGRDIRQILRHARKVSGPPTINVTLSILIQACEALEYAHTRTNDAGEPLGLVHRDVSPSNLMVTRSGHLKVIDFGIAKAQIQQLKTHTGKVKGKLAYMAPEATLGRELDARSDLFSIGIIAHELLTARPLFASKSDYQTMLNVQKSDILPPSAFNQAVPPELDAIVMRALARDPDQRYSTAAALRDDLHGVRIKYQLSATNREVQAWSEWAFSLEAPGASFSAMQPSWSGIQATPSPTRMPLRPPAEAPRASQPSIATPVDEEAAAIAWGGGRDADAYADADGNADDRDQDVADYGDRTVHTPPTRPVEALAQGSAVMRRTTSADTPATATPTAGSIERQTADPLAELAGRRRGSDALKIGLGFALAGVIAAIVVVARGRGHEGGAAHAQNEAAELATLKFIVEPADATIKIAGLEPHAGAPWKVELEPGVVQIKITQPASTSWETSVELSAHETQTIRVVLSPAAADVTQATVMVRSDPPGLAVVVDGREVPERTPAKLMLDPGPHKLAIMQGGQVAWTQDLVAEARTQYEFAPSMSDEKRREREAREKLAAAQPAPVRPPPVQHPTGPAPVVVAPLAVDAGVPAVVVAPPPPAPVDASVAVAVVAPPAPRIDAGVAAVVPPPVRLPPPPPPVAKPVVVPPTAVHRTSGELPKIKHDVRVGQEDPHSVNVKICIDTGGHVTSVLIIKVTGDIAASLKEAIAGWRYSPYLVGGVATPACFVSAFALK